MENLDLGQSALAAAIGGAALWLAHRLAGKAAVQNAINSGFAELMKAEKTRYQALLDEMARRDLLHEQEMQGLRGQFMNLWQAHESLKAFMRRSGLDVPETRPAGWPPQNIIELPATAVSDAGEGEG